MGDLESPGGGGTTGPRCRLTEFGVFPKPAGCGGTAGVVDPSSKKRRYQPTGMRGQGTGTVGTGGRFTKTVVPKLDGNGCWQQHLQIFIAIGKSNGWVDETAALQLFAHLEGEALNVALLMPEGERANREGLSHGLANYYYSPERLAVFRKQFESVTRRAGADPATELQILVIWRYIWVHAPHGPGQI